MDIACWFKLIIRPSSRLFPHLHLFGRIVGRVNKSLWIFDSLDPRLTAQLGVKYNLLVSSGLHQPLFDAAN